MGSKERRAADVARLDAAWRRNVPQKLWSQVLAVPQTRPFLIPLSKPGCICKQDLENNFYVLRGILETFPERIPGGYVLADGIELLDKFHGANIVQLAYSPDNTDKQRASKYRDEIVQVAMTMKMYVQKLRRLFRRSHASRSLLHKPR